MASKFPPGSKIYAKDGRSYTVETAADGMVYCTATNGAETEFPESAVMTAAEWAQRSDGRRDISYARMKQSKYYQPPANKVDPATATALLAKVDRISPSLLDYAAYTMAERIMTENKDHDLLPQLSIVKSREVFDSAPPTARLNVLGFLLAANPEVMASMSGSGDNLIRALIDKGMTQHHDAFEEFQDRPRK